MPLRNVHMWFFSGLAHVNVLCGQVRRNYCERLKLGSFWHDITVLTSCLLFTVLVQEPQTGDVEHVAWLELDDAYSVQKVSTVCEVEDWSFNHRVTPVVYIHVVWCCTVVLRPWVLEFLLEFA